MFDDNTYSVKMHRILMKIVSATSMQPDNSLDISYSNLKKINFRNKIKFSRSNIGIE